MNGHSRTVYLATSGEYSDYRVLHVFTKREDAESYRLGEDVEERELQDGPVEVRPRYFLQWATWITDRETSSSALANPHVWSYDQDFPGSIEPISHHWNDDPNGQRKLLVQGWDRDRVMKVYSEQRAQFLADSPNAK